MIKLLVTHQNPDPDAIGACWLFLRFDKERFKAAQLYFVAAGDEVDEETITAKGVKRDEVVHVDTGLGPFDHHQQQNQKRDSATLRVYNYILKKHPEHSANEALRRIVEFINDGDHFADCWWPEADNDRYMFMFEEILKGLRSGRQFNDRELVEFGCVCLDGILVRMGLKVSAEDDIVKLGQPFETKWGKSLAIENKNDEVMKLALKKGFLLVVRKNEEDGRVRIKAVPEKNIDLTPVYERLVRADTIGYWYFHPSKTMLLNGSDKHPGQKPTKMTLEQIVQIVKEIT